MMFFFFDISTESTLEIDAVLTNLETRFKHFFLVASRRKLLLDIVTRSGRRSCAVTHCGVVRLVLRHVVLRVETGKESRPVHCLEAHGDSQPLTCIS